MATVLVVDDAEINRDLVRTVLGYHGHRIVEANGGAAALALLAEEPPDLVVTDILMPGMDGYDLARAIRADQATRRIPVLFYTADYLAGEVSRGRVEDTASRIIPKTGDLSELLDAVADALATDD